METFASYGEFTAKYNVYVPSMQRSLIPNHVKELKTHIVCQRAKNKDPIFGSIQLVKLNSEIYVIDGQHRLVSLKECFEEKVIAKFYCIIYSVSAKEEMMEIFQILNQGIPVPDFLLNLQTINKAPLLKEIYNFLNTITLFDNKLKNRPYINLPYFLEQLQESKLFSIIDSIEDFRDVFRKINMDNKSKYSDVVVRERKNITKSMWDKSLEARIYIGLDKTYPFLQENFDISPFVQLLNQKKSQPAMLLS